MKRIIAFLLALAFSATIPFIAYAEEEPVVNAKSAILMCIDTGEVLFKQNEYEHLSPASVTKIMTILLTLEALDSGKINLEDKVTASQDAVSMGGSQIWLEVGEQMTVEELLKAVVVASANDACTALGEYIAGSSMSFVSMMNERASQLGLKNTSFENCTGLDDTTSNHYSCAYDLAVISSEVMKHESITKYTTVWLDSLRNGETELNNTNKLINNYQGITGLKTGTTSNAGFCVSATASRDGMNLVAVILGSDTSEHRFEAAAYLLDYGFANYQLFTPNVDNKKIKTVSVKGGKVKSVKPVMAQAKGIVLPKGNSDVTYKYSVKETVSAPLKKGDVLGKIEILNDNQVIGNIDLVSPKKVDKLTIKDVIKAVMINI